jgi:hypothetical protein
MLFLSLGTKYDIIFRLDGNIILFLHSILFLSSSTKDGILFRLGDSGFLSRLDGTRNSILFRLYGTKNSIFFLFFLCQLDSVLFRLGGGLLFRLGGSGILLLFPIFLFLIFLFLIFLFL